MSSENIIQAKDLFELKKETGLKDLSSISDFIKYGDEGQQITRDIIVQVMNILILDYDFNETDSKFIDDITFLHMITLAIVDRQLEIKNELHKDIDLIIESWKRDKKDI